MNILPARILYPDAFIVIPISERFDSLSKNVALHHRRQQRYWRAIADHLAVSGAVVMLIGRNRSVLQRVWVTSIVITIPRVAERSADAKMPGSLPR
jgi:hypothetical protein